MRPYFDIIRNVETNAVLAALRALAQEHRLAIFRLLVEHAPAGLTAGAIAELAGLAPATLSFHLKELAHAGLIAGRQDGRFIWYRANFDAITGVVTYLTDNCCQGNAVCVTACGPSIAPKRAAPASSYSRKRRSA